MVGSAIYFMCLSPSKLYTSFILSHGEDPNPSKAGKRICELLWYV